MLPIPVTNRDMQFFCNGELIGEMKELRVTKDKAMYENSFVFTDIFYPGELKITGKIYTLVKWRKYRRYINRCNRWRRKRGLRLL